MASVTSLDKDLRKLRLDKYTPAAASEARSWIEERLGEKLPSPDLLEALKDGVALCKLVNMALPPPGVKFKQSAMPFVQMENISIFLRACQAPPLNLHQHDIFLTVDLFEQKDPTQVLQCLGAFSRAANAADPVTFPTTMGPRSRIGGVSPQATGPASPIALRNRGASIASNSSSAYGASRPVLPHRTGSPSRVSTWSRRDQESVTSPAWNIAQYGYMGGASQGNLGISFGGRRQITGAGPQVPSLAEKERLRREEEERQRQESEEEEGRRRAEAEAEEEQAKREEERRWEEETERLREAERRKAEEEQRQWDEQERQWQQTEQKRRQEEQEAQARLEEERRRVRSRSDNRLRGQFLSQYQAEQDDADSSPSGQVRELEKALELARQREAEYERERQQRAPRPGRAVSEKAAPRPPPPVKSSSRVKTRVDSWSKNEREFLQTQWEQEQEQKAAQEAQVAAPDNAQPDAESPVASPRPLPDPTAAAGPKSRSSTAGSRPLPDPAKHSSPATPQSRTDRLVSAGHTPASQPSPSQPQPTYSHELDATARRDGEDRRRVQSQSKARADAWASKSLLEREMEMERQRQREWEEAQKETAKAVRSGDGGGVDGRWDVGQWSGYTGGDGQNRGTQGIGAGRRQIVGPRPLPGSNH
ncbi:calponin-like domain-containing protein [Hirsutella rhossiliensis]|uniref:Calponin-like domain-containing protein n=1 Tax=Hirsutella rhossiliensis TaxID=111463 RepID=A0A9P8MZA2_9HYPO|nr:calponin-like domain-containing protein [Hirsutella rhossiliensis]KAH0963011.1 calponin-like domain-containing protein [Hirsutella rhossiliensis]